MNMAASSLGVSVGTATDATSVTSGNLGTNAAKINITTQSAANRSITTIDAALKKYQKHVLH